MPLIISGKEVVSFTGILPVELGGTGSSNASGAINSIVPSQLGQTGKYLTTDGTSVRWASVSATGGDAGTVTSITMNTAGTGLQVNGSTNASITSSGIFTISGSLLPSSGGTGQTMYQIGDILFAATTTSLNKLPIGSAGQVLTAGAEGPQWTTLNLDNSSNVVGPSIATTNAIARFDTATGKLVKNSLVTINDEGAITAPAVGNVIPFYFDSQISFPDPSTNHGAIAHSHMDGRMYFAHGGSWNELATLSDINSSPTNEITNTDGVNTWSVSVATTGVISMNTGRGGIEFGAMPEIGGPAHLHIMRPAGQNSSTDLFFGDDYNYVKMPGLYGPNTEFQQGVEIGSSLSEGTVNTWRFGTDGAIDLPYHGVIRNKTDIKQVNIVANDFAQLQWTTDAGVASDNPNNTTEPLNWVFVDQQGVWIETNVHGTGPTQKWHFGTDSELMFPRGSTINEGISATVITPPGGTDYYLTARSSNAPSGDGGIFSASIRSLAAGDPALVLSFSAATYPDLDTTIAVGDYVTVNSITMQVVSVTKNVPTGIWEVLTNYNDADPQSAFLPNIFNFSTTPPVSWTFGTDGNLILPANGDIKDRNGNSVLARESTVSNLSVRTVSETVNNITSNQSVTMNIDSGKSYILYQIETNVPAWIRAYVSDAKRTADASRVIEQDPFATSGVIAEAVTETDNLAAMFVPGVNGISFDTAAPNSLFLAVKNLSGVTSNITVTVTLVTLVRA